jgi:hypothetical protein
LFVLSVWAGLQTTTAVQTTVLPTQSDNVPSIPTAISGPSFDFDIPTVPSTANFTDPVFDSTFTFMSDIEFNTLLSDVEHFNAVFAADNCLPTFDPGFLNCDSAGFGASVPGCANPADDSMDLYGLPTCFPDPFGTSDFSTFAAVGPSDPLPLLPPPPPDSPPGASRMAEEPAASVPKSRRGPRCEVDEANIMTSTRSRVPSTRKRVADDAPISNRPSKKGKGKQGTPLRSLFSVVFVTIFQWVEHSGFANRLLGQARTQYHFFVKLILIEGSF